MRLPTAHQRGGSGVAYAATIPIPGLYLAQEMAGIEPSAGLLASIGVLAFLFGIWGWFAQGGRSHITATGIFMLSMAVFVGMGSILLAAASSSVLQEQLDAAAASHVTVVATWLVWRLAVRRQALTGDSAKSAILAADSRASESYKLLLVVGLLVTAAAAAFQGLEVLGEPVRAVGYAGILLILVGAAAVPPREMGILAKLSWVLVAAGLAVNVWLFFTGFGRIVVASLGLGALLAYNMVTPKAWHKLSVVAALIPALIVGGVIGMERGGRLDAGQPVTAAEIVAEGRGVESVYSPVETFAELIAGDRNPNARSFPRQFGMTFVQTSVVFIPREVWPGKPLGFGARLAEELRPEIRPRGSVSGHSMAALAQGEWYVNFSWFGLGLMAIAVGWALACLDRWQLRLRSAGTTRRNLLYITLFLSVTTGLATYAWSGSFSFMSRSGLAAIVVLGVTRVLAPRSVAFRAMSSSSVKA